MLFDNTFYEFRVQSELGAETNRFSSYGIRPQNSITGFKYLNQNNQDAAVNTNR
jgi:hypothetical protein